MDVTSAPNIEATTGLVNIRVRQHTHLLRWFGCIAPTLISLLALSLSAAAYAKAASVGGSTTPIREPSPPPAFPPPWPPQATWLKTCDAVNLPRFMAEQVQRDTFYAKMEQCSKGGIYMWGFGSLLNSFSIPKKPSEVRPYVVNGLKRAWAAAGPVQMEIQALAVAPSTESSCSGGFSSHTSFLHDKPRWADEIWCREATEGNLVFEFIYVPPRLKALMDGQRFFHWKSDSDPLPPSVEMADACLYTNVPPSATLYAPNDWYRLLQTYVDTVLIGALALGGETFVERTVLTTGFWSTDAWQQDRDQGYYPRSPNDLYCAYDGMAHIDGGACSKLLPVDFRFDWSACMAYQAERSLGVTLCEVLAVTTRNGEAVDRRTWLARVAAFVDKKLGEADLDWFVRTDAVDDYGVSHSVYDSLPTARLPSWTRTAKGAHSLLSLRPRAGGWPRLCDASGAPVWRGQNRTEVSSCTQQGLCSPSWRSERAWLANAPPGLCES